MQWQGARDKGVTKSQLSNLALSQLIRLPLGLFGVSSQNVDRSYQLSISAQPNSFQIQREAFRKPLRFANARISWFRIGYRLPRDMVGSHRITERHIVHLSQVWPVPHDCTYF
jgi:hypothetical protein